MEADSLRNNTDHMTEWQDMNLSPRYSGVSQHQQCCAPDWLCKGVVSLAIWLSTMQGPPNRKGGCLEP